MLAHKPLPPDAAETRLFGMPASGQWQEAVGEADKDEGRRQTAGQSVPEGDASGGDDAVVGDGFHSDGDCADSGEQDVEDEQRSPDTRDALWAAAKPLALEGGTPSPPHVHAAGPPAPPVFVPPPVEEGERVAGARSRTVRPPRRLGEEEPGPRWLGNDLTPGPPALPRPQHTQPAPPAAPHPGAAGAQVPQQKQLHTQAPGGIHLPLRARPAKPPREKRPRDITREDLASCFHMPSEQACKALGIGLTVLKRQCRIFGIARWPFRKLASLDRLIHNVESGVGLPPATAASLDVKSVEQLQRQKAELEMCAVTELDPQTKKLQQAYSKATHKMRRQLLRQGLLQLAPGGSSGGSDHVRAPAKRSAQHHNNGGVHHQRSSAAAAAGAGAGAGDGYEESDSGDDDDGDIPGIAGKRKRRPNPKFVEPVGGWGGPKAGAPGGGQLAPRAGGGGQRPPAAAVDVLASLAAVVAAADHCGVGQHPAKKPVIGAAATAHDMDEDGHDEEAPQDQDAHQYASDGAHAQPVMQLAEDGGAGTVRGLWSWAIERVERALDAHEQDVERSIVTALGGGAFEILRPGLQRARATLRGRLLQEEVPLQ